MISWWSLRKALTEITRASGIAETVLEVYRHDRMAKYFKALSHPTRALIIALMIDGKYYTKDEILELLSRFDDTLTPASIERHVRTLESYGVIKQYSIVRRGGRGRRAFTYVMCDDAREFMESLMTYLLTTKHLRMIKYVIRTALSNLFRDVVSRAKLATYLSLPISDEGIEEIRKRLNYVVSRLAKYAVTTPPPKDLSTCEEAIKFLKALTKYPHHGIICKERLLKILYASALTSESPIECIDVGKVGELDPKDLIKELIANCYLRRKEVCCGLLIDLAKSLRTYLNYVTIQKHSL